MTLIMNKPCPICGKISVATHRPFCSKGCADRDLLAWLGDKYSIAGESVHFDEERGDAPSPHTKTYSH